MGKTLSSSPAAARQPRTRGHTAAARGGRRGPELHRMPASTRQSATQESPGSPRLLQDWVPSPVSATLGDGPDVHHRSARSHVPGAADRHRAEDGAGPVPGDHRFPRPGCEAARAAQDADYGGGSGRERMVLGELLRALLHFTIGSLSIAGGIILLVVAVWMVLGPAASSSHRTRAKTRCRWRSSRWPYRTCSTRWASSA